MQEMQGLASFMAGAPASEVIAYFREAFSRFDAVAGRSGRDMRRYATRSQLLLAEFCCQNRLFGEANAALMRAQNQVLAATTPVPHTKSCHILFVLDTAYRHTSTFPGCILLCPFK